MFGRLRIKRDCLYVFGRFRIKWDWLYVFYIFRIKEIVYRCLEELELGFIFWMDCDLDLFVGNVSIIVIIDIKRISLIVVMLFFL